jgi:hypothetical protein
MEEIDHEEYVRRQADETRNMRLLDNEESDETIIQERIINLVNSGFTEDEADKIVRESYYENVKKPKYERQLEELKKKKQMEEEERLMNQQKENEEFDKKNKEKKEKAFRGILEYLSRIRDTKFKNKISDFTKNSDSKMILSSLEADEFENIIDNEYLKRKKVSNEKKDEEKNNIMDFIDYEINDTEYDAYNDYDYDYDYEEGGSKRTTRKRKSQIRKLRKNKRKQTRKRKSQIKKLRKNKRK